MSTGTGVSYYCKTCQRTMDAVEFYCSNRLDKYPPDGHFNECKKCLTRHVDNWDPKTYVWILQEADVPYIPDAWNQLMEKYARDKSKVTGTTIIGRYLSKMKLTQWRKYRWADTEALKAKADAAREDAMVRQGFSNEEIEQRSQEEVIDTEALAARPDPPAVEVPFNNDATGTAPLSNPIDNLEPDFFEDDLTEEDRKYLTIKWGKPYKPYEWVQLEQYYQDMINAFDIQTPAHIDYLKLICKTSLKCHQLLNIGDVDGFQKMSKIYDMLMKSAKFTAAQTKDAMGSGYSAVDELVRMAEQEGFIPRYYIDTPNDKVDATIQDMRTYTSTLVRDEMNLGNLIENAIKTMQRETEKAEDEDIDDEDNLEAVVHEELNDSDFSDYRDFIDDETALDAATEEADLNGLK